ncbi:Serine/threonine-protein kinase TAO1-B [Talaromyces islandicus]|uniref:Serine/threonine-protein kinase TAO1-B n=1 Tax=Talaromyces islandicus TaxID=28573 RepID=A0A0U1LK60_TALIS|nr:Serine/threonine-protein kinase TAO1-B [Talaromyces islandicus]
MWKHRFSAREDQASRTESGLHLSDLGLFGRSSKKKSPSEYPSSDANSHRSRADSVSTTRSFRSSLRFPQNNNHHQQRPESALSRQSYRSSHNRTPALPALRPPHADTITSTAASAHSNRSQTSFNSRSGRVTSGMMDGDRTRSRRERTFVGSACAVCEEPLEHTLRGERVLQFSCTHVSHEACFYEYIKEFESQYCPTCNAPLGLDTSRGGNVLDLEKLSNIVRSQSVSDGATLRSGLTTPWDNRSQPTATHDGHRSLHQDSLYNNRRDSQNTSHSQRERIERLTSGSRQHHVRQDSGATGVASSGDYNDGQHHSTGRRHDYDLQAMESDLSPRVTHIKNPIPAPIVTVRSEFPTLNRSRQQQPLTCLITVEVPDGHWRPDMEDLHFAPLNAQLPAEDIYNPIRSPTMPPSRPPLPEPRENIARENLDEIAEELRLRVDNWHGLEFSRFGKLRLYGTMHVGKDRESWQELECFLFGEMLICVKDKKNAPEPVQLDSKRKNTRCTLKGSILIKKHLREVEVVSDEPILTLNLSVNELPCFHLRFQTKNQLELWRRALSDLDNPEPPAPIRNPEYDTENNIPEDDDYRTTKTNKRQSSTTSSYGAGKSNNTALTEYTNTANIPPTTFHVPLDLVVVIPVSSSMQGLKITLLRDSLKFLVQNLGPRDRMGLVTFGSSGGGVPLVGMTTKAWNGWGKILNSLRPVGQKSLRADVVEGANVAMDLLMQRKSNNPISTILLISDSSTSDPDSVDFVVSRAEAAKVGIHSFGLGLTHKPDTLIELSTRTKACYTYVKDWMMLRECVAGCLGSLQSTSHQNVKLKLRLPEGSPAKFVKISGALHTTKRATGKDAEAALGDLRFGDKRDILVQLVIQPDNASQEHVPQDPWQSIVSGLEALGGGSDGDEQRVVSVEEVPLIQADLSYGDILRDGHFTHSPRPSLLAITMLPPSSKKQGRPITPPIPPHPSIVQRRMELLASDMLTRALTLVSRGQHDRAQHLLSETRSILKGLGKGGLPPLPPAASAKSNGTGFSSPTDTPNSSSPRSSSFPENSSGGSETATITPVAAVDQHVMSALDADLESALEWINHPAVFGRDSRKAVLQGIGVISSQRAFTYRTPSESLWSERVAGVKRLTDRSKDWRDMGDDALTEE